MRSWTGFALIALCLFVPLSLADGDYPACSHSQLSVIFEFMPDYEALEKQRRRVKTPSSLLAYTRAQLSLRETTWRTLPRCAEALEIALVIYHWAGDSFELAGRDASVLPESVFSALEEALTAGVHPGDRLEQIAAEYDGEVEYPDIFSAGYDPPTCTAAGLDEFAATLRGFQAVLEIAAGRSEWTGGYLTYVDALLAWRMENAARAPGCRIRLDLSSALASGVAGFIAENAPGLGQLLSQPGGVSPAATPSAVADEGATEPGWVKSNNLRACGADELRRLHDGLAATTGVIDGAPVIETVAGLLDQVN